MASQRRRGQEIEREVESLHQFHGPQQVLSNGPLPATSYRQAGGHHRGAPADELHGLILWLQSDTYAFGRTGKNILHVIQRDLLLHGTLKNPKDFRWTGES